MKRIKVIVAVSTDRWNRPLAEQYKRLKSSDTELTIVNMAVIVELSHTVPRVWRTVKLMGLTEKVASVRSADIPVLEMGDRERLRDAILRASEAAIEADRADVLVLGCGSMFGVREEIERRYKVPVVEPGLAALKLLESLLALGLSHSKRAFRPPPAKRITL